jgi:peroxisomal 3,2-trans-enoyl-CoA isomerase
VNSFIDCKKPIVAAVNGPALGIAATTLGLTDYVFMCESAYLLTPFQALGQTAEGCSTRTFPKLMGEEIANEVLRKNRRLRAFEARSCGFAADVLCEDSTDVLRKALDHCRHLLQTPDKLHRKIHEDSNKEAIILKNVNREELLICEKAWVCQGSFKALSNFLFSRKMYLPGLILK